jgi:copper homeostasis protein CutC
MKAKRLGKLEKTTRGFETIYFCDYNAQECSLQASSLAVYRQPGTSAIWLGVDDLRMHLDVKRVKGLIKHLNQWILTGSFAFDKKHPLMENK